MKVLQQYTEFQPVTIVLETREEVDRMWDIICHYCDSGGASEEAYALAMKIGNWFSNQAKL